MGTHPIFESDFDCLTENSKIFEWQRPASQPIRKSLNTSEMFSPAPIEKHQPVTMMSSVLPRISARTMRGRSRSLEGSTLFGAKRRSEARMAPSNANITSSKNPSTESGSNGLLLFTTRSAGLRKNKICSTRKTRSQKSSKRKKRGLFPASKTEQTLAGRSEKQLPASSASPN